MACSVKQYTKITQISGNQNAKHTISLTKAYDIKNTGSQDATLTSIVNQVAVGSFVLAPGEVASFEWIKGSTYNQVWNVNHSVIDGSEEVTFYETRNVGN